jgi:RNA polymerase sigma factor (sigma-70 family)
MSFGIGAAVGKLKTPSSDVELVSQCLNGHEAAWNELISKYKNLIFSIPIRTGFSQEESADIFQAVCLDLFCELSSLRDPQALAGWLIRVTHNKCIHKHRENARYVHADSEQVEGASLSDELPEDVLHEIQKEQSVRTAIGELNPRCRLLVEKLFFELPARPYEQVARELGLAVGSIGVIRRRCLDHLRDRLEELGVD